jgi:hypothetical protein
MNTFWEGKLKERVEVLQEQIPTKGSCDKSRPMLEDWRKLQNVYYRHYNDGDSFVAKLRHMAKRHNLKLSNTKQSLETLADVVYAAAWKEHKEVRRG